MASVGKKVILLPASCASVLSCRQSLHIRGNLQSQATAAVAPLITSSYCKKEKIEKGTSKTSKILLIKNTSGLSFY